MVGRFHLLGDDAVGAERFSRSARHLDYIRSAYNDGTTGPYRFTDPAVEKPAPGDLLCLLRGRSTALGYAGLKAALGGSAPMPWQSHCDVVVAANVGGDRTLYLIGGNVFNTVMMRKMPLDRAGAWCCQHRNRTAARTRTKTAWASPANARRRTKTCATSIDATGLRC